MFSLYRMRVPRHVDAWLVDSSALKLSLLITLGAGESPDKPAGRHADRWHDVPPAATTARGAVVRENGQKTTEKKPAPILSTRAATTSQTIGVRSLRM